MRIDSIPGLWKTIDSDGKTAMSHVEIYEREGKVDSGGRILDPDNGKTYSCKIWREGDTLKVRGYVAFFFKTQTWHPLE